jgi:hypothetical protein
MKPPPTPMAIEYLIYTMKKSTNDLIRDGKADVAFSIVLSQNIQAAESNQHTKKLKILEVGLFS